MLLSRAWLFVTVPVALGAIGLLAWTALRLVRTARGAVVASVPVRAEQRVVFDHAGAFALNLEGPALARGVAGLRFTLSGAERGAAVPLHPILFRTRVSSFTRARLELFGFTLPAPGTYVLRVDGADPSAEQRGDAIVFTRRFTGALVAHVLALVALGAVLIGAIVISGFVLGGRPLSPAAAGRVAPASESLEASIARAAAVVRARTLVRGGVARYQVLETWAGAVPAAIAGAGGAEGLLLDPRARPRRRRAVDSMRRTGPASGRHPH
jgi:hypothetical protein